MHPVAYTHIPMRDPVFVCTTLKYNASTIWLLLSKTQLLPDLFLIVAILIPYFAKSVPNTEVALVMKIGRT